MTTVPNVGLWRDDAHRYYWMGERIGPGITSVISKVDKSGPLIGWAKGVTADAAIANLPELTVMVKDKGPAIARSWLTAHATAESDTAKDLGTKVHLAAEQMARGATPDVAPEHLPYIAAYQRFLDDWTPEFKSLERFVASMALGYGGTFDAICKLDFGDGPKMTMLDNKTGKGTYAEGRLQLAALSHAEFIGMPNDPKRYPMPKIEQHAILHIRPDAYSRGYQLYRVNVNDADWQAFQGALAIYRWAEQRPSNGEPMTRGAA
jgi:hypothetical protein